MGAGVLHFLNAYLDQAGLDYSVIHPVSLPWRLFGAASCYFALEKKASQNWSARRCTSLE